MHIVVDDRGVGSRNAAANPRKIEPCPSGTRANQTINPVSEATSKKKLWADLPYIPQEPETLIFLSILSESLTGCAK